MNLIELKEDIIFDGHYTLIRQLGRGGFSEVWLAHDSYMDLDVAIKIYAPGQGMDSNSIDIFRHEIKDIFHLNHPNLLTPKHLGVFENMPYLVMPYCSAGSCCNKIGKMLEAEIWHLIHDVASGLTYLHDKDIVHQDIKPDNILINTEGNYLITDFGISTRARSTLIKSSIASLTTAGTIAYMGPERFTTQPAPTKASDIWSFGAMLFELLEGTTPFPPGLGGSMQNKDAAIPTIKAPVSDKLKQTIYKMLSKETWDRPIAATLIEWANNPTKIKEKKLTRKSKLSLGIWCLVLLGISLITGLSIFSIRQHQITRDIKDQMYRDSIRQVQIQDSIREVHKQDSIRLVYIQDSIRKEHIEDSILKNRRQDSIRNVAIQEAEQKRIEKEKNETYTGSHNGHNYVDLGLSVKWATCNVGANRPEEYGDYFAWGEVKPKEHYNWITYKHCVDNSDNFIKYCSHGRYGYNGFTDYKTTLDIEDDAAYVNWGGRWRMPTDVEWKELVKHCEWIWTNVNGISGYKVKSKTNGNYIFLPAAGFAEKKSTIVQGFYWSNLNKKNEYGNSASWSLCFDYNGTMIHAFFRDAGFTIRSVLK